VKRRWQELTEPEREEVREALRLFYRAGGGELVLRHGAWCRPTRSEREWFRVVLTLEQAGLLLGRGYVVRVGDRLLPAPRPARRR
jgi:hypothetical protein